MISGRITIAVKLTLLILTFVGAGVAFVLFSANLYYNIALNSKMSQVRSASKDAIKVITYFYNLEKDRSLTRGQAQAEAVKIIKALRNEDADYMWVNTYNGEMIWHPNEALIGKNLIDMTDNSGTHLFRKFTDIARGEGGGFVRYYWPKPSQIGPVEKVSYISGFAPWEWVIGTGVYLDDVDKDRSSYVTNAIILSFITLIILTTILVTHWVFVSRQIRQLEAALASMATGKFFVNGALVHPSNEFAKLWACVSKLGVYLGSLERGYLDHEAEKVRERSDHDKIITGIITDCETKVATTWEAIKDRVIDIRTASTALNTQIEGAHRQSDELVKELGNEKDHVSDVGSTLETCRAIISSCSEGAACLASNNEHLSLACKSLVTVSTKFSRAIEDDLQQAIHIIQSAAGHIKLIDIILSDIVIDGAGGGGQKDYQSVSSETKSILQRMNDASDRLQLNRGNYLEHIPTINEIDSSNAAFDHRGGSFDISLELKHAENIIGSMTLNMITTYEASTKLASITSEMAHIAAKQNAELIKVVWKTLDAASSMEEIIEHIERSIIQIRQHAAKQI